MNASKPTTLRRKASKRGQLARLRHPALAGIVGKNIASIEDHRREADEARSFQERISDTITRVSGSLAFVCLHIVWFAAWILANVNLFGLPAFDPYPFGLLTAIVSLEAIFLSTFVLVSQNRQSTIADERAQLDLQINLLAEYEITRLLKLQDGIAKRLGIDEGDVNELRELEEEIEPEAVLQKLESETSNGDAKQPHRRVRGNTERRRAQ